jgi:hypothetical protein
LAPTRRQLDSCDFCTIAIGFTLLFDLIRLRITVVDLEPDDTQDPMQTALTDYRTSL